MVRQLQPWHANMKKRQVRAPKIYFSDTGLLHQLLGIHTEQDLMNHPKSGASWEGFVMEEVIVSLQPDEVYFWATHQGAEIDLVLLTDQRFLGVEIKRSDAPTITSSMRVALKDLKLQRISVVYPGTKRYSISPEIEAVPLREALKGMQGLFPEGNWCAMIVLWCAISNLRR